MPDIRQADHDAAAWSKAALCFSELAAGIYKVLEHIGKNDAIKLPAHHRG
jgi:hypothetical protein